jgi:SAM-dependent methyltransferase
MLPPLAPFLDVREVRAEGIYQDSVWIPASQWRRRVAELPSPGEPLRVIDSGSSGGSEVLDLMRRPGATRCSPPEWAAEDRLMRLWSPNPFLQEVLAEMAPGSGIRALDFGCGVGRDVVLMACAGAQVTGLDHLPDAIQRARDFVGRYCPTPLHPVRFVCGDHIAEEFDLVVAIRLHDVSAIRRMHACVRPGGTVVFSGFRDRLGFDPADVLREGFRTRRYNVASVKGREIVQIWTEKAT